MNSRCLRLVAAIVGMLLFSFFSFGQQETKKRWNAASLDGTSGLFKTWDADSLRQGETNWSFGYDQFRRDPGQLRIGRATAGIAVGLLDRLEMFGSMDVQKHVTADNIRVYRRAAGQLPLRTMTPTGLSYFSQSAPFMDVPVSTGRGDVRLGLKYNVLSERRGDQFSMSVSGFGTFPGQKGSIGLSRGLSTGSYAGGFAFLFSKTYHEKFRMHFNLGPNFNTNPNVEDVELAVLQNEFIYRAGVEIPAFSRLRGIAELSGLKYFGNRSMILNPRSPLDLIFGLRFYPKEWVSLGAGYQLSLGHVVESSNLRSYPSGYNGFVVQGTVGTRRNDPPTASCAAAKPSILQGDNTTIRASAKDPDGDALTYSWNTTGGKISGTGDTTTFDATGIVPGKYTVTATVKDKKYEVSCSSDITVLKRNIAPTASVEPSSFTVTQGESANLRCVAADGNNDPLTYTWSVDGQRLAATGPQITFGSEGRKPGTTKVECSVSDGEAAAVAYSTGTIRERIIPNQPPAVDCLTTTMDVASGGSIELRAKASDPDNDRLTYSWSSTGGAVSGSGETATFNAADVKAGSYTVTATVEDGRGGKASCSMTVNVSERLSVTKDKCGFFTPGGARVDNCAKAILDDLAVRMKNDSKLRANVIGYTDSKERAKKLGEKRAKAMAAYLEKQGVEASRLTVTDGGANNPVGDNKKTAGRKLNRRVEIELSVH